MFYSYNSFLGRSKNRILPIATRAPASNQTLGTLASVGLWFGRTSFPGEVLSTYLASLTVEEGGNLTDSSSEASLFWDSPTSGVSLITAASFYASHSGHIQLWDILWAGDPGYWSVLDADIILPTPIRTNRFNGSGVYLFNFGAGPSYFGNLTNLTNLNNISIIDDKNTPVILTSEDIGTDITKGSFNTQVRELSSFNISNYSYDSTWVLARLLSTFQVRGGIINYSQEILNNPVLLSSDTCLQITYRLGENSVRPYLLGSLWIISE